MARILVLDDDEQVRRVVVLLLSGAGHDVLDCATAADAMRTLDEKPVDLVITDIVMPDKEGLEVIMDLRREYPALPVIAISGGGMGAAAEYLQMASAFGARHVLAKPFTRQQLLDTVTAALGG